METTLKTPSFLRSYYMLTKPGIIFGNAVTAAGGFALASKGSIHAWLFLASLLGLSMIIASGCVWNNYLDRFADQKMARTKGRPLARGSIPVLHAQLFAAILFTLGSAVLFFFTNLLTTTVAVLGFLVYVAVYSPLKHRTIYGTPIGSIAGAIPPVVGYTAVTQQLDLGALVLFMIVVLWQMPHFFAIAIYRFDDYATASIPVLPVVKGMYVTKVRMLLYVSAFTLVAVLPTFLGYTGYAYLFVTALLSLGWIWLSIQGFKAKNDRLWGRQMFLFSLVVIMGICAMFFVK